MFLLNAILTILSEYFLRPVLPIGALLGTGLAAGGGGGGGGWAATGG